MAVYSKLIAHFVQNKRDLGFIEGDLIECLNAGDGSWWTGRLRRDRRIVGSFPANFLQVLDDDFQPASRATSPIPGLNGGSSTSRAESPNTQQSRSYRKPPQAYARPSS